MPATKGHIVILVENLPVPFDRRVWMESLALTEAGYKVSVICPQPADDKTESLTLEGVHIYRYPPPGPTLSKLSFVREFSYCYLQTRKILARIWENEHFDVIQTCNPPDTFWHIARKYKKHGVKFVFDHHDLCPELFESRFGKRGLLYHALRWLEKRQFKTADAVISTNESYRQVAIDRGGKDPSKVAVVRSGPMLSRFKRVPAEESLRRGRKYLGVYLGVMGPQDGVDYALRAIAHTIKLGFKDASFTFVGGGDEFDKMLQLSSQLGLDDYVTFTGRISDDELRKYLSTADLGVAPDPKNPLNDVSTMNKVVEYMAFGIPIVSFDLVETRCSAQGAAEYVVNDDEQKMGQAIIDLLNDPQRRQEMGRIGRQRFEKELAWEYSRTILEQFYGRLIAPKQMPAVAPPHLKTAAQGT